MLNFLVYIHTALRSADKFLLSEKMTELSGDDALTGHSYYSKEMVNFKMTYSYHNYVEPVLQEANDLAARNAKDIAGNCLTFAAVLPVDLFVLCR